MDIGVLLTPVLTGITLGMAYVVMAVGLTFILGMLDIPNFAHGALYALGAYLTYTVMQVVPSFWVGLVVAPVLVAGVAMASELWGIRPLYAAGLYPQLLFTFALSLVIRELIILIWSPVGMSVIPPKLLAGAVDLGVTYYPTYRLFLIFFAGAIVLGVWLFLERTKYGAIIRAGIENKEMVSALGINIHRLFTFVFGLGAGLAGLGGALILPLRGTNPDMGLDILPTCFVVVVVGGMGNFPGAIVAGLLIGISQSVIVYFLPQASMVSIFVVMAVVLLIRPQGLFGEEGRK
ncbi:MAG: branched-chain amino acid ABC transporter permease [Deltaproteobacteria bacterium]|nr:branched-chain amino acid ABC transporter permease [Deltaproteobacteria bacterium]